jgi:uncharacterized membrane protein YhaH (DUF805 family)
VLHWLFGFRGVEGRVRFLAGLSLLLFTGAALAVAVAVAAALLHWPGKVWIPVTALVLAVFGNWSLLGLSTRRLRDIGWPPILLLGGLIALMIAETLSPRVLPAPWGEIVRYPFSTLAVWSLGLVLTLWPGSEADGELRGGSSGIMAVASLAALVVAGAGLGLVFDPVQSKACPVYGAGAPGDDCESLGVIGRYYSSYLVVDANKRLGDREPARAMAALSKAIALRPQFVFAYNSQGIAYEQMGDTAKALAAYDRALALRPSYVHGLTNRAVLLDKLGQRSRALADLREILRVEPNNPMAKAGVVYMTGGR